MSPAAREMKVIMAFVMLIVLCLAQNTIGTGIGMVHMRMYNVHNTDLQGVS